MAKGHPALMACVLAIVSTLTGAAQAQVTQQQQDAVRANCRSDFLSLCRGVTPGGAEALGCLKQNAAKLAPACKRAVDAINLPGSRSALPEPSTVGAAPSVEPPVVDVAPSPRIRLAQLGPLQMRNLQMACAGDSQIFCVGVPRDPQARIACLRDNAANLSPPCQQALRSLAAAMPGGAPGAAAAPAAAAGAPAGQPSADQQAAIRASCRSDAMSLCPGQQGQQAFQCLNQNAARLSPSCKQAVAAVAGPAASAAAAPAARSTVPAGAVAQAQPSAEQQAAIRSNCRSDAMSLCPGQQGQQAFQCLNSNSARLSAACRTAIGAVAGAPAAAPAAAAPAPRPAAPAPAAAAPAPAAQATAAAPASPPTQAQQDAIRANCRSDAMSLCPGQQGQQAFQCLSGNSAKLSAACRTAVSAVGAPAAATAPAAAPARPAAAPAAAPAAVAPAPAAAAAAPSSEAESMTRLAGSCGGDIQIHCKGVSLGGGRLMACLAVNGDKLSTPCKQALTEVSQSR